MGIEDADLIELACARGCLKPVYDRASHPGFFQFWHDAALAVIAGVGLPGQGERVAEADRFCGQPLDLATARAA